MSKLKTIADLRRTVAQEKFDRKNTKVFVKLASGETIPVTGIELDMAPNDEHKMAVFFTTDTTPVK